LYGFCGFNVDEVYKVFAYFLALAQRVFFDVFAYGVGYSVYGFYVVRFVYVSASLSFKLLDEFAVGWDFLFGFRVVGTKSAKNFSAC